MADIAKDYEYMKNGMNIRDIFETIKDSPGYIGYSFTNYPKDYCKPTRKSSSAVKSRQPRRYS